jgi:hypothetical protein
MPIPKILPTVKIKGFQGQWSAQVTYPDRKKEMLACVHKHFISGADGQLKYNDRWIVELALPNRREHRKAMDLMRKHRRVIVTTDKINKDKPPGDGYFIRTGYVGVYGITNPVEDDNGVRFDLISRIANAA